MADVKTKTFGVLPMKVQPYAVAVLVALFAFVIFRAYAKIQQRKESVPAVAIEPELVLSPLSLPTEPRPALPAMMQTPEERRSEREAAPAEAPSRDPFLFSAGIRERLDNRLRAQAPPDSEGSSLSRTEESLGEAFRAKIMSSLSLSGTVVGENGGVALINNRLVGPGQTVEGFRVREIRSREVILEDAFGKVILKMTE